MRSPSKSWGDSRNTYLSALNIEFRKARTGRKEWGDLTDDDEDRREEPEEWVLCSSVNLSSLTLFISFKHMLQIHMSEIPLLYHLDLSVSDYDRAGRACRMVKLEKKSTL